ncbi:MAG: aminoacyl-tRNA hydrolase [Planctomycetes bacterium]|nr:aminoacyl-tRNA hydrolase [Planctomycetota bacterium]
MAPREDVIRLPLGVIVPLCDLAFEFSRGGGPGGQNVNKVASRVTLRFDVAGAACLPEAARTRLLAVLRPRLTSAGELVLHASEHRTQARNRAAALERFARLLGAALAPAKKRRPTRPTRASIERRIGARRRRAAVKKWRRRPGDAD